ncbi:choice-of-anchor B domain-containing protein [Kineococcus xinjiangensis]|uniref:Choice-of-anchor B domain-containing protein n=1 Tax=Kineococcus xinjiangensis TaxID=512762 RepID=A0A2S6IF80_9ACTN|nr:choice-of-anchor B family protein [Kineococcus xinjiangensis]PPK92868.1 choice-of-anchor B domain-containing protein [Kineococcus xinjiangensis]
MISSTTSSRRARRARTGVSALAGAALLLTSAVGIASAHPTHDGSGKEAGFDLVAEQLSPGGVPMERMGPQRCEDGKAGIFPCHKVDLAAFLPLTEMDSVWSNDVWGWTDPKTKREYALVGLYEGTAFVDVTVASNPVYLGTLPTAHPGSGNIWRDAKVYRDHVYIVSEARDRTPGATTGAGLQVFDLTQLRGVTSERQWTATNHLTEFTQAHNIALNEQSGFAYVVGAYANVTAKGCEDVHGGLLAYDLKDPANPVLAGCFGDDGYTHDVQCVDYAGPDVQHRGREICIASNEDTVTIVDATDKKAFEQLARVPYETSSYTHQGWLTEDHRYFLLGDELDELNGEVSETTTYIWDLTDLDAPVLNGTYGHGNPAIDHNIFVKQGLAYQSNYTSGLRITDTWKANQGRLTERGFFDVYPADDSTTFAGTWSNYPYFPSGTVVVTGTEEGLFVLKPRVKSSDNDHRRGAKP